MSRLKSIEQARDHIQYICEKYRDEINEQISNTVVFEKSDTVIEQRRDSMDVFVYNTPTVKSLYEYGSGKCAVLDFASYKSPGGRYLNGFVAQEEALCMYSTLYPVLYKHNNDYYIPNMRRLNNGLYDNNGMYVPNVLFEREDVLKTADVIVVAPPSTATVVKYTDIPYKQINAVLKSRIDTVLNVAYSNDVDTLILGAFSCGFHGSSPSVVAKIFKELLTGKYYRCFDTVIFAIHGSSKDNEYEVFKNIILK